jgi:hypothetical protein
MIPDSYNDHEIRIMSNEDYQQQQQVEEEETDMLREALLGTENPRAGAENPRAGAGVQQVII